MRVRANDGHAVEQFHHVVVALDDERVNDPRQALDLVDVRADHLAADRGALLIRGVQHVGHARIDAEQRAAGDDHLVVDAGDRAADDRVVLAFLELERSDIRHGLLGGERCELRKRTEIAGFMRDAAVRGRQFLTRHFHHDGTRRR